MAVQPRDEQLDGIAQQALRREVNDTINEVSTVSFRLTAVDRIDVVCECVRPGCSAVVAVTVGEYEAVRRFPARFFVKAGHELAEGERVVSESADYVVVETNATGAATQVRRSAGAGRGRYGAWMPSQSA